MDNKQEKLLEEWRERHAEEFREKHGISMEEWDLAEAMAGDHCRQLFTEFWEVYDRDVPPADNLRPAKRHSARHRKR